MNPCDASVNTTDTEYSLETNQKLHEPPRHVCLNVWERSIIREDMRYQKIALVVMVVVWWIAMFIVSVAICSVISFIGRAVGIDLNIWARLAGLLVLLVGLYRSFCIWK